MISPASRRVVITGMGLVCPLGNSKEAVWEALSTGRTGIGPLEMFPSKHVPTGCGAEARQFTGHIDDFGPLDKTRKRTIRKSLKVMCREIQMGVAAAQLAMHDAHLAPGDYDPERTGVLYGADYMMTLPGEFVEGVGACLDERGRFQFARWAEQGMPKVEPLWILKYLPNMSACHIAIFNQLYGPNNSITIREASPNLAVGEAYCTITRGAADILITGGAGTRLHPVRTLHIALEEQLADGDDPAVLARPFDLDRTGMVVGEGAGAMILESLETAQARAAPILAEVVGYGNSAATARNTVGHCRVAIKNAIARALETAGFSPEDVGHLHAHGLGTRQSDIDEAQAINDIFGDRAEPLPVVAAKSYFGNLGAGGGMVELITSILAIERGRLFRTLNHQTPDPRCPVSVVTTDDVPAGASVLNINATPQGQAGAVIVRRFVLALLAYCVLVPFSAGAEPQWPADLAELPLCDAEEERPVSEDWLIVPVDRRSVVSRGKRSREIVLDNGLIRRTFRLAPNAATVGYDNLMTGAAILRGVKPEAIVELDGAKYAVGGLLGQPDYGYLRRAWLDSMTSDPSAFQFAGFDVGKTKARFPWKAARYAPKAAWPPPGVSLVLYFDPPRGKCEGVRIAVHYEMYDGIPLLCKWLTIANGGKKPVTVDTFIGEILAAVEYQSDVELPDRWEFPNILVESDYAFNGMSAGGANKTTHWVPDPQYASQVNYRRQAPVMLESRPPIGPDMILAPGESFETFRTFELVYDSTERERKGLAQRRMYRTLAPWAMENPILMHVRYADPASVRRAVDQCAEVGFEMVIMTFGSGINMENEDPDYLARIKTLVAYAHSKGIELGGYSLLASRRIGPADDVIHPETGKPGGAIFGNSPCLCSRWGEDYFRKLYKFIETTGIDVLEHDGSYPGDVCASTSHPGHRGLNDSQWKQWKKITDFYKWCRARGVYLNVPDWYFLSGSNKTAMGYRETNWSLPRARQIILGRQNIFDGTWYKAPSMGWMFVPLVQYHGGGAAATLEPLREHLDAYEAHLAQNFGSGVQACYRGPRLYDAPETKALVKRWVDFYKRHRPILDSDVIHVRRADGEHVDCLLHVNPALKEKGLAMIYNPSAREVETTLKLPLYYTGLTRTASIREKDGTPTRYQLDRSCHVVLPVTIPARSRTWFVIQ